MPQPYLVQEFVPGEDLATILAQRRLSAEECLHLARQLSAALQHAHAAGLIHRDVKPGNIRITADQQLKLLDFGLGKWIQIPEDQSTQVNLTRPQFVLGTRAYLAPEVLFGEPATSASDMFSFEVTIHEMSTGRRMDLRAIIRGDSPANPETYLAAIINRCCAREPSLRPSAGEIVRALEMAGGQIAEPEPVMASAAAGASSNWLVRHRDAAMGGAPSEVFFSAFFQSASPFSARVADLRTLMRSIDNPNLGSYIGKIVSDERWAPRREQDGLYASFEYGNSEVSRYWAARALGEYVYFSRVPSTKTGAILFDYVFGELLETLWYFGRLAAICNVRGEATISFALHNIEGRVLGSDNSNWAFTYRLSSVSREGQGDIVTTLVTDAGQIGAQLRVLANDAINDIADYFGVSVPDNYFDYAFKEIAKRFV